MTHAFLTTSRTPLRTFVAISTALFSTLLLAACSGGPQAALPLAPSASPSSMLSLEAAGGSGAWDTLGKGKDKGHDTGDDDKGKKGKDDEDAADDDAPHARTTVKIEGVVSTVTGVCPALTVVVGLHTVVTDAATTFHESLCAQLAPEAEVDVRAVRQADGTLLARSVEFEDEDAGDDDIDDVDDDDSDDAGSGRNPHHGAGPLDGTVSSFRGVCPAVTFNLRGMRIVADAATTYVGGTCATLRPNVQVVVTGVPAPGRRMFKAEAITITRTH